MNKQFDSYTIEFLGGPVAANKRGAYIYCYDKGTWVGRLQFLMNISDLSNAYLDGNVITLSFGINQFQDVLRILEYEKPLYLYYDNKNDGRLCTWNYEPAGEQEAV